MARVTSTGITFSDATILNSKYGVVPQSKHLLWYESAAPTGWTKITDHSNKALRLVSGNTGGQSGGTNTFTATFASTPVSGTVPVTINDLAVGNTTLTVNQIPSHNHPVNAGGNQNVAPGGPALGAVTVSAPGSGTGNRGGDGAHNHPVSYTSASGPFSQTLDLRVAYVDIIICSFD